MKAELNNLPYFRISHIQAYYRDIKPASVYQKISRWIRRGNIIQLKKGYYVTAEYMEKHRHESEYIYYLANILRYPSYVSGVYRLQEFDILTDITFPITSVTTKSSRAYANKKIGNFVYYSISPKLYTGYTRLKYRGEPVYAASKAKALFDYLYFKFFHTSSTAKNIFAEERINTESITAKDVREFEKYCALSAKPIMIQLARELKQLHKNNE